MLWAGFLMASPYDLRFELSGEKRHPDVSDLKSANQTYILLFVHHTRRWLLSLPSSRVIITSSRRPLCEPEFRSCCARSFLRWIQAYAARSTTGMVHRAGYIWVNIVAVAVVLGWRASGETLQRSFKQKNTSRQANTSEFTFFRSSVMRHMACTRETFKPRD